MVAMAEIFTRYGPDYLAKYGPAMLPSHKRAYRDILRCRTPEMGGQVYHCQSCGHTHYVYHSCRNRSCPQCHYQQTQAWLEARRRELLNAPYFHVVFTIPDALNAAMRRDQTRLYGLLMRAAASSLIELANDPHYVGGTVGVLAVLHTWGRTLMYHPHVHCLVTGGGLDRKTDEWCPSRPRYLVPVRALSKLFRRRFRELLGPSLKSLDIPAFVWRRRWVVHCKPVRGGPDSVLRYLAGYVYRTAISEDRILSADNGQVTFRYKDTRDDRFKTMTLPAEEFIRRFLQHVLPAGFHKVRYYGLWAPGNRWWLRRLQLLLGSGAPADLYPSETKIPPELAASFAAPPAGQTCPVCGKPTLVWIGRLKPHAREPPPGAPP
jgi:hypothetical protein